MSDWTWNLSPYSNLDLHHRCEEFSNWTINNKQTIVLTQYGHLCMIPKDTDISCTHCWSVKTCIEKEMKKERVLAGAAYLWGVAMFKGHATGGFEKGDSICLGYYWSDGSSSVRYSSIGCLSVGVIIYGATRLSIYIYSGSHWWDCLFLGMLVYGDWSSPKTLTYR